MKNNLKIFTDGGARGNPGPAAIGVVILDDNNNEVVKFGKKIGETTNNVAEYKAVVFALEWVEKNLEENLEQINFYIDSLLVVNQLNGKFKIKNLNLKDLIIQIKNLEKILQLKVFYNHIPREKNVLADFLVNTSLDH